MKKELSNQRNETTFEIIKQIDNYNNEFWSARDLSRVLEYVDFRNFLLVIKKAKKACKHSG
jgi:DNA-damage-inducible protein D